MSRSGLIVGLLRRLGDPATSDAMLLDRYARDRDEAAFAEIVQRHGQMVLGVCRRTLGDRHTAEDAFQATFLVLARKAAKLTPGELAGWLHGVARRTALKARSSMQRPLPVSDILSSGHDPLDELTGRELLAILEEEVQRLPEAYRLPVALCCIEGLSQETVAQRLNSTVGSIRGRLARGRAKLHGRLVRRGVAPASVLAVAEFARASSVPAVLQANRSWIPYVASQQFMKGALKAMLANRIYLGAAFLLAITCAAIGWLTLEPSAVQAEPPKIMEPVAVKPVEPEWGEPDGSIQIRLRPKKAVWAANEMPTFDLDMRSIPVGWGSVSADYQYAPMVLIDGEEYEASPFKMKYIKSGWVGKYTLEPGKEIANVDTLSLDQFRPVKDRERPIELKPGKHVIRITALVMVEHGVVHPQSKAVMIEISEPKAKGMADLDTKLVGDWKGGSCQGNFTFNADGTFNLTRWSPGNFVLSGTWSILWDELPPTLVIKCKESNSKEYIGKDWVVKITKLNNESLEFNFPGQGPMNYRRLIDEKAIQGKWKVLKEEIPDATSTKWVEDKVRPGDSFTFADKKVVWVGEASYGSYHLILEEEDKWIEMRSEAIRGIADVKVGLYKLEGDKLMICFGEGRNQPADFSPKAPAKRLYYLEREKN